ncbi:MAG TPA: acyltransferase [Steroidobacteraceae bacterium]|nr:acyltransferase [Steroidobacteraceae bacterium]
MELGLPFRAARRRVEWEVQLGIIEWAHRRESPLQRRVFALLRGASTWGMPALPGVHDALLAERRFRKGPLRLLTSKLYYEPLLRRQCQSVGRGLLLHEEVPKIIGNLSVRLGERVTLSGAQVWISAGRGRLTQLEVGDDCSIGYGAEFAVGDLIRIGRHVKIANYAALLGYDGHALDPLARARNEPPEAEGVQPIIVHDYAWIGFRATVLRGVTIGRGAVVAACAVVARDVPELTVVAGNPAKAIRQIEPPAGW